MFTAACWSGSDYLKMATTNAACCPRYTNRREIPPGLRAMLISFETSYQGRDAFLTEHPSVGHQHISDANCNPQGSRVILPVESSWHHVVVNQLPLPPKVH